MFIYEGCMGDLYVASKKLTYEQRHCPTCGDTDSFIGEANTAEEAWKLLEPKTATHDCDGCKNDNCDDCPYVEQSYGYNYAYVARFIAEEFADSIRKPIKLVLISTNKFINDSVFVKYIKNGDNEYLELPTMFTLDENITFHIKEMFYQYLNDPIGDSLKLVGSKIINDTKYIFFSALSEENHGKNEYSDDPYGVLNVAHYCDDAWYGYVTIERALKEMKNPEILLTYQKMMQEKKYIQKTN